MMRLSLPSFPQKQFQDDRPVIVVFINSLGEMSRKKIMPFLSETSVYKSPLVQYV